MKQQTLLQLAELSQQLRSNGRRIVATNGCFDILHVGHVRYLAAAARLGDALIVGVNADESVRELKGAARPLQRAEDRAEVLAALSAVDYVTIYPELRATNFLAAAAPAIYCKGGDYSIETLDPDERAVLQTLGTRIEIIPFAPGYSTTAVLSRIDAL